MFTVKSHYIMAMRGLKVKLFHSYLNLFSKYYVLMAYNIQYIKLVVLNVMLACICICTVGVYFYSTHIVHYTKFDQILQYQHIKQNRCYIGVL